MFLNRPLLIPTDKMIAGRTVWRLAEDLVFESRINGWGLRLRIPHGFCTDLASTPRLLWPIFPPAGIWSSAAILHDYLYGHRGVSRFLADALFRESMHQLGVPLWRRLAMYYAVRVFGRRHFTGGPGA